MTAPSEEPGWAPVWRRWPSAAGWAWSFDLAQLPREAGCDRLDRALYSESLSRIVLTIPPARMPEATRLLAGVPHADIGAVTTAAQLVIRLGDQRLQAPLHALKAAWQAPLLSMQG